MPERLLADREWTRRLARALLADGADGAGRDATPAAAEDASEHERLARAVLALDPPHREVVVLRFHDDIEPAAVAERLRVRADTVETRLDRALTRLRATLDEAHGGDGAAWRAALAPLAARARRSSRSPVGLRAAMVVLALCAVGILLARGLRDDGRPSPAAGETAAQGTTDSGAPPAAATRTIRGVVGCEGDGPAEGAMVWAKPDAGGPGADATTAADGSFELTALTDGAYELHVRPRRNPPAPQPALPPQRWLGAKREGVRAGADGVKVVLPRGLAVAGVVVTADGAPIAGKWVRADVVDVRGAEAGTWAEFPGALTAADGSFEIDGLAPGTYRLLAADPKTLGDVAPLVGADRVAAGTKGLRLTIGAFARIAGVVVDEAGKPVFRVLVRAFTESDTPVATAGTDAGGHFVLPMLDPAVRYTIVAPHRDFAPAVAADVAGGTSDLRLVLVPGLRASGRVLDAKGAAVANAELVFRADGGRVLANARTDADGRFVAEHLLDTTYRAQVVRHDGAAPRFIDCGEVRGGAEDAALRCAE